MHSYSLQGGRLIEFLLQVLGNEESDKVQALICTGFAKLMLSGMISDERYILSPIHFHESKYLTDPQVLVSLALIYLSPDTADNQELRQCLSYFFPVYSYSAPAHQRLMQKASESFDPPSSKVSRLCAN